MNIKSRRSILGDTKAMHLALRQKNRVSGTNDLSPRSSRYFQLTLENVKRLVFPIMDVGWDKAARVPEHFDE